MHQQDAETVTITLPLPPGILSPNCPPASFGGRMGRAAATKKQKKLARKAALEAEITTGPWELASVRVVFYHKSKSRRDPDNFMGMLKSAYDGFVDAGLLVDDDSEHLKREEPSFEIDKDSPRVEVTLTRL